MSTPITIPATDDLRADIRRQAEELRAKRKLLKLAEAADAVRKCSDARLSLNDGKEVPHG